jgi:hypothetical protein
MQLFVSNVYILYRHITYNMTSQINTPTTFLPSVLPSGIGGNAADYQAKIMGGAQRKGAQRKGAQRKGSQRKEAQKQRGGQGYGYEGKEIAPGKMEFSSYKGGKSKRRSNRRQQRKSKRRQNKSRRR